MALLFRAPCIASRTRRPNAHHIPDQALWLEPSAASQGSGARVDVEHHRALLAHDLVLLLQDVDALVPQFDRADKRPFSKADLQAYWKLIANRSGPEAAALRLHLLTGGQRVEQFVR